MNKITLTSQKKKKTRNIHQIFKIREVGRKIGQIGKMLVSFWLNPLNRFVHIKK